MSSYKAPGSALHAAADDRACNFVCIKPKGKPYSECGCWRACLRQRALQSQSVSQLVKLALHVLCALMLCRVWQVLAQTAATQRRLFAVLAHWRLLVVPREQLQYLLIP
jgi:hypothetical protein